MVSTNCNHVYTDGSSVYEEDRIVPINSIKMECDTVNLLLTYVRAKYPGGSLYDYGDLEDSKLVLNKDHPWLKDVKNGRKF